MLDLQRIRDNPQLLDDSLKKRGLEPCAAQLLDLDQKLRDAKTKLQELQQERNRLSKEIGIRKAQNESVETIMAAMAKIKKDLPTLEQQERESTEALDNLLSTLPNLVDETVPVGPDPSGNQLYRTWGEKPDFSFTPQEHDKLGGDLGLIDFETAARMSGTRFVVLRGALAQLERALAMFMLDIHTREFGYTEILPPFLIKESTAYGTGHLPKFREDLFATTTGYFLIPTAEVSLTSLVASTILDEEELPKRFTAWTPCFRSEAGAAGKDTRGMIRQHQFSKVELVSVTTPDQSQQELERMLTCAEEVLKRLDLHYRVMTLCSGDMGFAATKTYDIEVWLPGQQTYREISSCSNCTDFQGRRMKARYRPHSDKATIFVHTLNGSGLAVGRTMIALLENYQQEDGSIVIPQVLRSYMNGMIKIECSK